MSIGGGLTLGAHIFLVGEANFEVCIERGVYGCVMPSREWNKAEIIAGIFTIEVGDLVFFYVKNRGIYGLWKVTDDPYFDEMLIWDNHQQSFPYRFSFESTVGYFPKPIFLADIYDLRDKGRIWTFDLNPVQQKNQYKITMSEARELLRLLLRNNPLNEPPRKIPNPYLPPSTKQSIDINLKSDTKGKLRYEGWLNAWFMHVLAKGELKHLLGDYKEYINLVPTTFNKVMDIFLTHTVTMDSIDIIYKYTCIELKTDRATEKDLTQILRYEDWLTRKLGDGDSEMIQSVLVAARFANDVIDYVRNRQRIEEKTIRLLTYRVTDDNKNIELREESLSI